MKSTTMNRRTLTMTWDGLGGDDEEDDDQFFDSHGRISSFDPLELGSSGSDEDDSGFQDSRMSFVSTISSATIKSIRANKPSSIFAGTGYDMWTAEPGDVRERRKRLLQGMGLASSKDMLRLVSSKIVGSVTTSRVSPEEKAPAPALASTSSPKKKAEVASSSVYSSSPTIRTKTDETTPFWPSEKRTAIVLVRSRSEGDIDGFSVKTKQRTEELIGQEPKQRLTRTSSGIVLPTFGVFPCVDASKTRSYPQAMPSNGAFAPFFLIKNLETGNDFVVKEYNDVQTGKQLTAEEIEKSVGFSPVVSQQEDRGAMDSSNDSKKFPNFSKSFRNSKRRGAAILKNIKEVATSMSGLSKEQEHSTSQEEQKHKSSSSSSSSPWIRARQHGKSYKEFTALYMSQEIQAHEGSIWVVRFNTDGRLLASAGEDTVIHVWEVQECDVMSARPPDDTSSASGTPVHSMSGLASDRPLLAEITSMPSEKKRGRKNSKKKDNSIPSYVNVPETVFALLEKPYCTLKGHQDEILDLAWSKSQLLLSSSMDNTVRLWDIETKRCLKMFAHNSYVTCVQFNPVDEDYFLSGSLDSKVRIWSIPDRHVVEWIDLHEMVTAASYTPDGQCAIIGSHQGICRLYSIEDHKLEHKEDIHIRRSQTKKLPGFQSQPQPKKVTGFQFAPWNPSEVLITSNDSRIRLYSETELIQKYRGYRNTSSQISASFTPDGKHVISASEDSQVCIWKVEESKNPSGGRRKSRITVQAHENFQCKDVSVAISWPGSIRNEPPLVEIHSKRHSKRSVPPPINSPTKEDTIATSGRRNLPPLPKKPQPQNQNQLPESSITCGDEDSAKIDPGMGVSDSFSSSSGSFNYNDPSSISNSPASSSLSWSSSWSLFDDGGGAQTVQATAWGLVIVTATLDGEIKVYQNFGLPLKVGRQSTFF